MLYPKSLSSGSEWMNGRWPKWDTVLTWAVSRMSLVDQA